MTQAINGDRFLFRAILASLALHVVLLALIPPLTVSEGAQTVETIAFVHVVKMQIERPTPKPPAAVMAQARSFAVIPTVAIAHRVAVRPRRARAIASPTPQAQRAPVVAAVAHTGDANATVRDDNAPVASPSVAPAPPQDQNPPSRQMPGGMMPLGVEEPVPVLEPSVYKALLALGVHVTLTVTVDEHGRTKSIAFAPPLAGEVENTIRSVLASASWDPAVCGAGMACESSATIRL